MTNHAGIQAVRNFWDQVWKAPQNYDAIDELVVEDFVLISGGKRFDGRGVFKQWAQGFGEAVSNLDMEEVETFGNPDGSRVATIWRLTGTNNGAFGTKPDGKPIEITGIAVWAVREDGMLLSNQVERNAFEVYQQLIAE
jgi:hypothetical protein